MAKEFAVDVECTEGGISGEVGAPHGDGGCVDVRCFVGALGSVDVVGCCREVLVCCRKMTTCSLEIVVGADSFCSAMRWGARCGHLHHALCFLRCAKAVCAECVGVGWSLCSHFLLFILCFAVGLM